MTIRVVIRLGLDVAVKNQVVVGMTHRVADLQKSTERFIQRPISIVFKGVSLDILHHQVRLTVVGSTVQQLGHIRVLHVRQNLALVNEARTRLIAEQRAADELDCDYALVSAVGTLSFEDRTHATVSERFENAIRPDLLGWPFQRRPNTAPGREQAAGAGIRIQQSPDTVKKTSVITTLADQPLIPRFVGMIDGLLKQRKRALIHFLLHAGVLAAQAQNTSARKFSIACQERLSAEAE